MNIKDFLIDNYIWIIVIILITIITIIGFLADKKKGSQKNKDIPVDNPNMNSGQPTNNMGPIQYQPPVDQMNNNMGMNLNNNLNNSTLEPINQMNNMQPNQNLGNLNNMNTMQQEVQMASTAPIGMNQMNNPQIAENVTPMAPQEPMYQPLSEQKPVIAPQPVPDFSNLQSSQEIPQQVDNVFNPTNVNVIPGMTPAQINEEPNTVQTPNYNVPNIMPQPVENNNFGNIQNFNQNNTTIPQPVSPIPTPQPVNPQPMMQGSFNNQQMVQHNFGGQLPQSEMLNQPVQQAQPGLNQPINFVYGPQNNNQNM